MENESQEDKWNQAIDLMIEDLYTRHIDIRIRAKKYKCEKDLDAIKEQLISYLQKLNK
jgi:hypothetical protein